MTSAGDRCLLQEASDDLWQPRPDILDKIFRPGWVAERMAPLHSMVFMGCKVIYACN